jgi:hypothetical protein
MSASQMKLSAAARTSPPAQLSVTIRIESGGLRALIGGGLCVSIRASAAGSSATTSVAKNHAPTVIIPQKRLRLDTANADRTIAGSDQNQ